jgi:hypothetical protein
MLPYLVNALVSSVPDISAIHVCAPNTCSNGSSRVPAAAVAATLVLVVVVVAGCSVST